MALFKFRKGREDAQVPASAAPSQTVEAMRRRAIHRLVGAAVLVLAGVVGFPIFFDNQPRPIPVDLPIVIPDKSRPVALVAPPAASAPAVVAAVEGVSPKPTTVVKEPAAGAPAVAPAAAPTPAAPAVRVVPPAPAASSPTTAPPAAPATATAPVPAPAARVADANKARDLLEGKAPPPKASAPAGEGRFIVQVGAFSDADKVREVRRKVEGLGVKTYTQVVETKDGSRTRVRVGPYADRAEAARIAEKIRRLDLSPAILSL